MGRGDPHRYSHLKLFSLSLLAFQSFYGLLTNHYGLVNIVDKDEERIVAIEHTVFALKLLGN